jgi:hypothetical protein
MGKRFEQTLHEKEYTNSQENNLMSYEYQKACIKVFIEAFLVIAKSWKQLNCLSMRE